MRENRKSAWMALIPGLGFAVLSIATDTLIHLEFRWKQVPAWLIAGVLFGIAMQFYTKRIRNH
ncbi:hypothetical protein WJU16_04090 [Chitinophaga pollutisoli]|uniref:Uncharacterized protein n=1 Tax=Chitinophaga pollutisoli TaxID=3133966 RepID=A0ABZ2YQZ1_9BACT